MACSPDEQKRLTVTAEALTGMPARRLAIRATFIPCSASGIAHPRITSSIAPASIPGARRIASLIAAAASSSGRDPRNAPFGALPTAVRTAETMTASCIFSPSGSQRSACELSLRPVAEQVLNRVGDFSDLAVEQMVCAIDHDEL